MEKLIERIGIDRSVLCDFQVTDVDWNRLEAMRKNPDKSRYADFEIDRTSEIKLKDGSSIGMILIVDRGLRMEIKYARNNLSGEMMPISRLELNINDNGNNLQNLTSEEYRLRIIDVFARIERLYGVCVDYSSIRVKRLEINATIPLRTRYSDYRLPILMMIRNVPKRCYGNTNSNNAVKYATWYQAEGDQVELETALVKNSSIELKIYNKGKHLIDKGLIAQYDLEQDYMRIEYTIKDARILKTEFGDSRVIDLSDDGIRRIFARFWNRDIAVPWNEYRQANHRKLIELTVKHRARQDKWVNGFFRECRQYNETHRLPVLFDLQDMRAIIKELEPEGSKNAGRKFRKFIKQAYYERDLDGNTALMQEILDKIDAILCVPYDTPDQLQVTKVTTHQNRQKARKYQAL